MFFLWNLQKFQEHPFYRTAPVAATVNNYNYETSFPITSYWFSFLSIFFFFVIIIIIVVIVVELTHSKTMLENPTEIEPQTVALDFKNLSQYSSRSK